MANVYVPGNGLPPDPQGSGSGNDYSTGKNFDRNRGAAASLPPVASWQVSGPGKGFHVKADALNQVAADLQDDIATAQTVLQELRGIGAQLQGAMGQWPTGQTFGYMAQDALSQVEQIHQKLLQAHSNVVQNLQATAAQYGATEAANTATVNAMAQQNPSTSSTVQAS